MAEVKPKSYAQRIAMSKDQTDKETRKFVVKESAMSLAAYLLEQEKALATAEKIANEVRNFQPIDIEKVIASDEKVESLKIGMERLQALKAELFPTKK